MSLKIFPLVLILLSSSFLFAQDLYDTRQIAEIKITFEESNWDEILDKWKQEGSSDRLAADVELNGKVYPEVGVRYKGNSSYYNVRNSGSTKLPFNIEANFKDKDLRFPGGIETLKLSNIFRDPSFLREVLAYEIARKYMPAPKACFAKVYVNGTYLGLYNLTESIDKDFLDHYYYKKDGVLFKCDPAWHSEAKSYCPEGDKSSLMYLGDNPNCYFGLYEIKSDSGWTELIELTRILNQEPDRIEEILDVDRALWMLAFNNVLVNLDSYTGRLCHNYYLYQLPSGKFTPIIWDMNMAFGAFRFDGTGQALSNEEMQTLSPFLHYKTKNLKRPLITNLLNEPLYRKIYIGHLRTILEENFVNGWYLERGKELMEQIEPEVLADKNKLYDATGFQQNLFTTAQAEKSAIIGIEELMAPRIEYLSTHPVLSEGAPSVATVEHIPYGNTMAVNATIKDAERAFLMYRFKKKDSFTRLEMFDDSGHNDEMAQDDIWGATVELKKGLQYYIIAEGDRSAVVSPKRASLEFYEYEKEEENQ